ncbi:MAG: type II secretion system protein GspG [Planctomycetota bacterium]|jgi:hypothetical protein
MSQTVAQVPHEPHYVMVPARDSNGLGVAGFFISLIGLFIPTGVVALLGLLISLVALGRPPRGFAAAGVLLGLLGAIVWLVITAVAVIGAVAVGVGFMVFAAAAFILTQPEIIEVTSDLVNVGFALVEYEEDHGVLPEDLGVLGLGVSTLSDPWGNRYRYQLVDHDPGFDVWSSGGDGEFGTADDVALSHLDRVWEDAFASFGQKMEELGERLERLDGKTVRFDRESSSFGCWQGQASRYEAAAKAAAAAEPPAPEAPSEPAEPEAPAPEADAAAPSPPEHPAESAPVGEPAEAAAPATPGEPDDAPPPASSGQPL